MVQSLRWLPAVALLVAAPSWAAGSHPFNARDLVTLRRLSESRVSPDGKRVAFVLRTTDLEADKGRTDLWMVESGGGNPRQLTFSESPAREWYM